MEEVEPLPGAVVTERDVAGGGRLPPDASAPPAVERVGAVLGRLESDGGFSLEGDVPFAAYKKNSADLRFEQGRKWKKQTSINTSNCPTSRRFRNCSICGTWLSDLLCFQQVESNIAIGTNTSTRFKFVFPYLSWLACSSCRHCCRRSASSAHSSARNCKGLFLCGGRCGNT